MPERPGPSDELRDRTLHVSTLATGPRSTLAICLSRLLWRRRAEHWDRRGSALLGKVVDAVVAECGPTAGALAVDLGCGSGQVTFPLASTCSQVLAVDIDSHAIKLLEERARHERRDNIRTITRPIETIDLQPDSVDLVVSNYALHHLRDADKRDLIQRGFRWLRPGGRLVIGDMMFGRGADSADREIIRQKIQRLAGRGPGGWWRIVKNAARFMFRFQEKPLRPDAWEAIVRQAGFERVRTVAIAAEACVLSATKPSAPLRNGDRPELRSRLLRLASSCAVALGIAACGNAAGGATSHGGGAGSGLGRPLVIYHAPLSGHDVEPSGAPHGIGAAIIALHHGSVVCWRFAHLHGFHRATAAWIGVGPAGATGRGRLTLGPGRRLHHQGCTPLARAVFTSIQRYPSRYSVTISSASYPEGAIGARL